jgi:hypothetical protein
MPRPVIATFLWQNPVALGDTHSAAREVIPEQP